MSDSGEPTEECADYHRTACYPCRTVRAAAADYSYAQPRQHQEATR